MEAFSVEKTCWSLLYGGNPKEDSCLGKFSFLPSLWRSPIVFCEESLWDNFSVEKTFVGSLVYGENLLELSIEELQDGFSQTKNCKITSIPIEYLKKDLSPKNTLKRSSMHRRSSADHLLKNFFSP